MTQENYERCKECNNAYEDEDGMLICECENKYIDEVTDDECECVTWW